MKKNTGSFEEKNKKDNLPDFTATLIRRRRTVEGFLVENGINTPEAFDAFVTQKSDQFSFNGEFLGLRAKLAKIKKDARPAAAVVAHETFEEESGESGTDSLFPEGSDSVSNNLEEQIDDDAADLKKKSRKRKVDSAV